MLKELLSKPFKLIPLIIDDILIIAGVAFLYFGTAAIYPPAGLITLGICLIAMAVLIASRKPNNRG